MAEDSDLERTEPASERRLQEAREKGQVPRSRELLTFAVLMTGVLTIAATGPALVDSLTAALRAGLRFDAATLLAPDMPAERLWEATSGVLIALAPLLLALVAAAVLASLALSGWVFSAQAFSPDFKRLNPAQGLARMFSWGALAELVKAVVKTALIGGVAAAAVWHERDELASLSLQGLDTGLGHMAEVVRFTVLAAVSAMLLVVAMDVPFQLWESARKLRMTKEEVRKEARESEGDPHVKARIRQLQREAARRRMMGEVPKADVVVTNPTHFAVALRYQGAGAPATAGDPSSAARPKASQSNAARANAPKVVAKGADLVAGRIVELAREHRIPVVESPPLARALFRHADLGVQIPAALYQAVAEVLAYVYQLRAFKGGGGPAPAYQAAAAIPDDYRVSG